MQHVRRVFTVFNVAACWRRVKRARDKRGVLPDRCLTGGTISPLSVIIW
jgi:hypothetical protein